MTQKAENSLQCHLQMHDRNPILWCQVYFIVFFFNFIIAIIVIIISPLNSRPLHLEYAFFQRKLWETQ